MDAQAKASHKQILAPGGTPQVPLQDCPDGRFCGNISIIKYGYNKAGLNKLL
jgi:hypothetical protein